MSPRKGRRALNSFQSPALAKVRSSTLIWFSARSRVTVAPPCRDRRKWVGLPPPGRKPDTSHPPLEGGESLAGVRGRWPPERHRPVSPEPPPTRDRGHKGGG